MRAKVMRLEEVMIMQSLGKRINYIVVVALLWMLVFFSYSSFYVTKVTVLYWIGGLLSFASIALTMVKFKNQNYWLLSVLLFVVSQRALLVLRLPEWGFSAFQYDASFNLQLSSIVQRSGTWSLNMGTLYSQTYSYHPALHIFSAALSDLLGLDLFTTARIIVFVNPILTVTFFYLAVRNFLTIRQAALAAYVYSINETFLMFDHYVMEAFSLVFYTLCLFLFFRVFFKHSRSKSIVILWVLSVFVMISAHHWTSYNLLITLVVLSALPVLYARLTFRSWNSERGNRFSMLLVLLAFVIVFTWIVSVSYPVFDMHVSWFSEFITNVSVGGEVNRAPLYGHRTIEIGMIYFGQFVLIILGILQLRNMLFSREKQDRPKIILTVWFIFSIIYLVWATFMSPGGSSWIVLSRRNWEFTFFGVSPLIGILIFNRLPLKNSKRSLTKLAYKLLILLLIFPLISTLLLHADQIRNPSFPIPGYSLFSTTLWVKKYMPNGQIAADSISAPTLFAYAETEPMGEEWMWGGWPGESYGMRLIYRTQNVTLFPNVLFNWDLTEWYPDITLNSSLYDQRLNNIFDSSSFTMYQQVNATRPST